MNIEPPLKINGTKESRPTYTDYLGVATIPYTVEFGASAKHLQPIGYYDTETEEIYVTYPKGAKHLRYVPVYIDSKQHNVLMNFLGQLINLNGSIRAKRFEDATTHHQVIFSISNFELLFALASRIEK